MLNRLKQQLSVPVVYAVLMLFGCVSSAVAQAAQQPTYSNPYAGVGQGDGSPSNWTVDANGFKNPCGQEHAAGSGPGTAGAGLNGSPDFCEMYTSASGFLGSVVPILQVVLPVLLLMLAIWKGPMIIRLLSRRFSRG
jgi:uncharacterized protein YceK